MALKKLPSVVSLKGFEACARHLNFSQAAAELHLSQSAISHQIRQLEELLGATLFERNGGHIRLTDNGDALLPVVRNFLRDMTSVVEKFEKNSQLSATLEVFVHDSFATTWLLPRLSEFYKRWPNIDVKISTEEFARFDNPALQLAIRIAGKGHEWPGLFAEFILEEKIFPVCSPQLIAALGDLNEPADILKYPLIFRARNRLNGESVSSPSWEYWLEKHSIPFTPLNRSLSVPHTSMAVQAAVHGLGVAMARTSHICDEFATGRLQKLPCDDLDTQSGYYFLCAPGKEHAPEIKAFYEWLKEETSALDDTVLSLYRPPETGII